MLLAQGKARLALVLAILKLELQEVVSCRTWMLATDPEASARTVCTLNCLATALTFCFYYLFIYLETRTCYIAWAGLEL